MKHLQKWTTLTIDSKQFKLYVQDFIMNIIIAATSFFTKFSQGDKEFYEVALEMKKKSTIME